MGRCWATTSVRVEAATSVTACALGWPAWPGPETLWKVPRPAMVAPGTQESRQRCPSRLPADRPRLRAPPPRTPSQGGGSPRNLLPSHSHLMLARGPTPQRGPESTAWSSVPTPVGWAPAARSPSPQARRLHPCSPTLVPKDKCCCWSLMTGWCLGTGEELVFPCLFYGRPLAGCLATGVIRHLDNSVGPCLQGDGGRCPIHCRLVRFPDARVLRAASLLRGHRTEPWTVAPGQTCTSGGNYRVRNWSWA